MRYRGRHIDPVALWSNYVEFPANMDTESDRYLSKVICPNPGHDTFKRHFQINANDGLVHCFANCGISGTFEHAIAVIEGCTEREARKIILKHQRSGIPKPAGVRKKGGNTPPSKAPIRPDLLRYETFIPQAGLEYLNDKRKISGKSISRWELGWCPDEKRIVIPAKDETGMTRFLIKREILGSSSIKYLYSPEKFETGWGKTDLLFGAGQIDRGMLRSLGIVLVEGSLDVIRLSQVGVQNAVAILGSGISEQQRRIISRMRPVRIYLMFDRDSSGIFNIESAGRMLRKYPLYVCRYPKGKGDPAELSRREAQRVIERAIPLIQFKHDLHRKGINLNIKPISREKTRVG
jgi:hypothetical protein